jgi:hypothetical protein
MNAKIEYTRITDASIVSIQILLFGLTVIVLNTLAAN